MRYDIGLPKPRRQGNTDGGRDGSSAKLNGSHLNDHVLRESFLHRLIEPRRQSLARTD